MVLRNAKTPPFSRLSSSSSTSSSPLVCPTVAPIRHADSKKICRQKWNAREKIYPLSRPNQARFPSPPSREASIGSRLLTPRWEKTRAAREVKRWGQTRASQPASGNEREEGAKEDDLEGSPVREFARRRPENGSHGMRRGARASVVGA